MRSQFLLASVLILAASCSSTLPRAPGPESPRLLEQSQGTLLLLPPADGLLYRTVTVVDLPSLRSRKITLEHSARVSSGVDSGGRFVYLVEADEESALSRFARQVTDAAPRGLARKRRWSLRLVDVGTGSDEAWTELDDGPFDVALSPVGGNVALWRSPSAAPDVRILALGTRAEKEFDPGVGAVLHAHWLADGVHLAVDGREGGAILDATTGGIVERSETGFGPFSPDGSAFLARRDLGYALVDRASGSTLVADARFPWPYTRDENARENDPATPLGLCGAQLGIYPGLPTEGARTHRSIAWGGYLLFEEGVIKVCDLASGEYATVWIRHEGAGLPRYSPARVTSLRR